MGHVESIYDPPTQQKYRHQYLSCLLLLEEGAWMQDDAWAFPRSPSPTAQAVQSTYSLLYYCLTSGILVNKIRLSHSKFPLECTGNLPIFGGSYVSDHDPDWASDGDKMLGSGAQEVRHQTLPSSAGNTRGVY